MTSFLRSLPTLSAALLLGAAIGFARLPGPSAPASSISPPISGLGAKSGNAWPSGGGKTSAIPTSGLPSKSAYAGAWELLQDSRLPREDRLQLQSALLEEWCMLDLEPALRAAFGELPDDDPFSPDPLAACAAEIASQPDFTWDLIARREFGLSTRRLRWKWIETAARECPRDLIRHLSELPADCIEGAIHMGVHQTQRDKTPEKDQVIAAALAFQGTSNEAAAMKGAVRGLATALELSDLRVPLLDASDARLRDLYFDAYVADLDDLPLSKLRAELELLPPDLRTEVEASPQFPKDPKPDAAETLMDIEFLDAE